MHRLVQICLLLVLAPSAVSAQSTKDFWQLNARYTNPKTGVTFRYPSSWSAGNQWGYHPPALTVSQPGLIAAGFGFSAGGFPDRAAKGPYSHSNLEGVGIVYAAVIQHNATACVRFADNVPEEEPSRNLQKKTRFRGVTYSERRYEAAGMSQATSGIIYATYRDGTCHIFELDLSASSAAAEEPEWPPVNAKEMMRRLTSIMHTVQFTR